MNLLRPALSLSATILAAITLTSCDKPADPAPAPASATAAATPEWPRDQVDFIALSADLKSAQTAAGSDAERDDLRKAAPATFCTKFNTIQGYDGWIGTVNDIRTSTVNQSIDFEVDIGGNIKLEEVLQATDTQYPAVAALHVGDKVRLSGTFVHTPSGSECVYYLGPFTVENSSVAKL